MTKTIEEETSLFWLTFEQERQARIKKQGQSSSLKALGTEFLIESAKTKYSYNFSWMGLPIIQYPQDLMAMQEIIWEVKPDLIIETGVAHGGSLVFYASLLGLYNSEARVVGIDVEIRGHNRNAIESHSLSSRIQLIEGSSIDSATIFKAEAIAKSYSRILVCLDSNHTEEHVLKELESYSKFVSKGSYLVCFDTSIEDFPANTYPSRKWDKGNNPMTAVQKFMASNNSFEIATDIDDKLLISVARSGFLRRTN